MTSFVIDNVPHESLTRNDLARLRALFDAEYFSEFGVWDPDQPYGYAPHDFHLIARLGDDVVGHVGWARRTIGVGAAEVVVAGVGGVLISPRARGRRAGARLMAHAAASMADSGDIEFGYLGCREEVVAFYESCGWHRVSAAEHSMDRAGQPTTQPPGLPILTLALDSPPRRWPEGTIDLRGRAW
ncbi:MULTISPECIES: GNAT family N-acetyltransferase [unclassified Microbacterium]|uniref:GNAT family N-acetyltransferase n=1 Tax=unclassified Microbacterium TaxID=2609290 RepID=UPI000CFC94BF|nr:MULTISPECIES: GNAT family N-acetyltransferase [unclassified Microbacterium]PQZ57391.1 GNAT family N-acetyltransferase [Microbacterium sp. MYb43]PQZ75716.1 GNAT family N-acetyltransferase [Microbacterium sp. MYb40]PRB22812.1 GNAT family N-acetyltransferase [Microbacterium sp. MYb54]PRB28846.1 GNAT family N-acetyltransferase [Microbacterium sp. MYb50]PRB69078.1 GNAT family N-acetyltransferase [Microbacterium sp. MYb24]